VTFFAVSCNFNNKEIDESMRFFNYLDAAEVDIDTQNMPILVIPMESCEMCRDRIVSFYGENKELFNRTIIIISGVGRKQINLNFPKWFLKNDNVYLETKNLYITSGLHESLSMIFYLTNGSLYRTVRLYNETLQHDLENLRTITYYYDEL